MATSGQPQFIASTGNRSFSNAPLIENSDSNQIVVPDVSFISYLSNNYQDSDIILLFLHKLMEKVSLIDRLGLKD
jgi:hypothetical protein